MLGGIWFRNFKGPEREREREVERKSLDEFKRCDYTEEEIQKRNYVFPQGTGVNN